MGGLTAGERAAGTLGARVPRMPTGAAFTQKANARFWRAGRSHPLT